MTLSTVMMLIAAPAVAVGSFDPTATRTPLEGHYATCDLGAGEGCPLSKMPRDTSTVVRPGGKTRCISTKGTPYQFQVIRGDADKVLVYFQGGGSCWDAESAKKGLCVQRADPSAATGIFDRTNAKNPYRSHTVVQLLFCSGDAFAADDKTQTWVTEYGDVAVQTGQQNADATLDWLKEQVPSAPLADLVVSGDSAGSLAAQVWADRVLSAFPSDRATVLADSYLGVFPVNSQGFVLRDIWPACTGTLGASLGGLGLGGACENGTLSIQAVTTAAAKKHANAPWALIQSKADAVQLGFFEAIALSFKIHPILLSKAEFYERANAVLLGYEAVPNIVSYFVNGAMHTFTEDPLYYRASGAGPDGGGSGQTLIAWINALARPARRVAASECAGAIEARAKWRGYAYCAAGLANKTFTPAD